MKTKLSILLFLLQLSTLFAQETIVIGHRGASQYAPENTLASFKLAWELGADAVEGDFYLTKDQKVVCCHDSNTLRTSGISREITATTYKDLLELDFGKGKGKKWRGQKIPLLSEIIETIPEGKKLFIEIKGGLPVVPAVIKIIKESGKPLSSFIIICFDPEVISETEKMLPEIETSFLKLSITNIERKTVVEELKKLGTDGISLKKAPSIDNDLKLLLKKGGFKLHIWTINTPAIAKRYLALGINSITTNKPDFINNLKK